MLAWTPVALMSGVLLLDGAEAFVGLDTGIMPLLDLLSTFSLVGVAIITDDPVDDGAFIGNATLATLADVSQVGGFYTDTGRTLNRISLRASAFTASLISQVVLLSLQQNAKRWEDEWKAKLSS